MDYLERFRRNLERKWKGSLISVAEARGIEPNAKKYLSELAAAREVEKVSWGWYWIPDKYRHFFDFLAKDKHFKILQKQSAAALWNGDFVHRETYTVAVRDRSYARALKSFASLQGWKVEVEAREFREGEYGRMQGLRVEALEETIVDCVKEWAFADAFASVFQNHKAVDWDRISKRYWERIPRSNVRVGQVLKYGEAIMNREPDDSVRARISDGFVSRQVEEAAQRVIELA
jgi:hypothetical protein